VIGPLSTLTDVLGVAGAAAATLIIGLAVVVVIILVMGPPT
jgi:hypothetical protein